MTRAAETNSPSGARAAADMRPHAVAAASLLRALANEQRLMILCHLVTGPLTVGKLNERVPLSQSALSQHLAVLRERAIVRSERDAQSVRYSLPPGLVTRLLDVLHDEYCNAPDSRARPPSPGSPPGRRSAQRARRARK